MPLKTAMMPRPMAETMLASCRGEERKRSSHEAGPFNGQLRATRYGYSAQCRARDLTHSTADDTHSCKVAGLGRGSSLSGRRS